MTINVGVLFSETGHMAVTESAHLAGTMLAIDEINENGGINGELIKAFVKEPASNDQYYGVLMNQFLDEDIWFIFGCCSSKDRKSVLPIIEQRGGLLFYPSFYEGFEYSPNIIYSGATPNQAVLPLIEYLYKQYGRRFFLVGSDYIYPYEINRIIKEYLFESHGTIAGEYYLPQGSSRNKFDEIAKKISKSDTDVVISTVVGADTVLFYEAYSRVNIDRDKTPIASLTTSEGELALMNNESKSGHITSASYFQSVNSDENTRFLNLYRKKYGDDSIPSIYTETAYLQVHMFANAMMKVDDNDPDLVLNALMDLEIDAPQGKVVLDPDNNHVFIKPRIGRSTQEGTFDLIWESNDSIKPDPYLVAYDRVISDNSML